MERLLNAPDGPVDVLTILEPDAYVHVQQLVDSGVLPEDTFLRLNAIGDGTADTRKGWDGNLRWQILLELAEHGENPDHLSPLARNIILGETPRAFLCWDPESEAKLLHTNYDPPFLLKNDLVDVIKARREIEAKTVRVVPQDRRWRPAEQVEQAQCSRIAHGLWSVLARRIMPEWLDQRSIADFYRPVKLGTKIELGSSNQEINRRVVGAVALSAAHIKEIYDEACEEGVAGIGPVGRIDLRTLLAEEYPELY